MPKKFYGCFLLLWPYLLTTKLRHSQKNNFRHTNIFVSQDKILSEKQSSFFFYFDVLDLKYKTFQTIDLKAFAGQTKKLYLD